MSDYFTEEEMRRALFGGETQISSPVVRGESVTSPLSTQGGNARAAISDPYLPFIRGSAWRILPSGFRVSVTDWFKQYRSINHLDG